MAKLSSINKNERRKKLAKKYAGRYARLKAVADDESKDDTERLIARLKMAEIPRNANPTRVRDFRGLNPKSFDGRGNYAMGLKEQIVFPEIEYDRIEKVRGMDIIVTTTAKTDDEARELLRLFNFPFPRDEEQKQAA
jgi:hypothetical protein